jgi:hypothetical protein
MRAKIQIEKKIHQKIWQPKQRKMRYKNNQTKLKWLLKIRSQKNPIKHKRKPKKL